VDLKWQRQWGQFGASWIDGTYRVVPAAPFDTDRQALNLWAHSEPAPLGLQTEYRKGRLPGKSVDGWFGQVAYNHGAATPFFRYET
jgi:hypothetical protein